MTDYTGTSGADTLAGSNADDNIRGLEGDDFLIGLGGNDLLFGDDGNDTILGGPGSDILYGNRGVDTASYEGSLEGVIVDLTAGTGFGGDAQGDRLYGIENVVGTEHADGIGGDDFANRFEGEGGDDALIGRGGDDDLEGGEGDDTLDGGTDDDTLDGGSGNDALYGGAGSDILKGFAGADRLDGGDGIDSVEYSKSAGGVTVSLADGTGSGGDAEGDMLVGIEWLTGSLFADSLTGDAANNLLVGMHGDDRLSGRAGNDSLSGDEGKDVLDGGIGADRMAGGDDDDIYRVDNAGDTVEEENSTGVDLVESSVSFSLAIGERVTGELENLTLLGDANIDGTGNAAANTIIGNDGANVLDGKGGADELWGLSGNDTYIVDNAGDVVDEAGSGGRDTVLSEVSFNLSDRQHAKGKVEDLTLTGTADIDGAGNELANVIEGNAGANVIAGRFGNDVLTGGAGADSFVFDTTLNRKSNLDTITDFGTGDTIVLDQAIFGRLKLGELKLKAFHEGKKAHDGNDRVIYNEKNGALTYDKNGDNKGGAIKFALLDKGLDLSEADFLVI